VSSLEHTHWIVFRETIRMVVYFLYIKAELEEIALLSLNPKSNLCIDIRNPTKSDETREKIIINPNEYARRQGGEKDSLCCQAVDHHFSITWEKSETSSFLNILSKEELQTLLKKNKGKQEGSCLFRRVIPANDEDLCTIRNVTPDDYLQFVPVAAFEGRGIEPYAFHPMGGEFIIKSQGGHVFEGDDVDLSDDWADWDTENEVSVCVMEFESKFEIKYYVEKVSQFCRECFKIGYIFSGGCKSLK